VNFKLGDWVLWYAGGDKPHMVVDVSPCGHRLVLACLSPVTGRPEEFVSLADCWRKATA
jgi:hypothetical protein